MWHYVDVVKKAVRHFLAHPLCVYDMHQFQKKIKRNSYMSGKVFGSHSTVAGDRRSAVSSWAGKVELL